MDRSEQARQLGNFIADMINKPKFQRDLYEHADEEWYLMMDADEAYHQRMESEAIEREAIEEFENNSEK